jgi:hypothetical protein
MRRQAKEKKGSRLEPVNIGQAIENVSVGVPMVMQTSHPLAHTFCIHLA